LVEGRYLQNGSLETQYPAINAPMWNAKTGNNSRKPSGEMIRLLFKASGLPMQRDVHTIAMRGINWRILSTKDLA
jgi:hypothetical protein